MRFFFLLFMCSSIAYAQQTLLDFSSSDINKIKSDPDETKDFVKQDSYILDFSLGLQIDNDKWIHRFEINYLSNKLYTKIGNWQYCIDENYLITPEKRLTWEIINKHSRTYGLRYFVGKKIFNKKHFSINFLPNIQLYYTDKINDKHRKYDRYLFDKIWHNHLQNRVLPKKYDLVFGSRLSLLYNYKRYHLSINIDNNFIYRYKTGKTLYSFTSYNEQNEITNISSYYTSNKTHSFYTNFFRTTFSIGYYFGRDKL